MSNIHEALEQARREKSCSTVSSQVALEAQVVRGFSLADEMSKLHHQVGLLLADGSYKVLQFVGCSHRAGVSTIVREFASAAVNHYGKSVLILDPSCQELERRINFNVTCEFGWFDMDKDELPDRAFFRFGDSNLYFASISVHASLVAPSKNLDKNLDLWAKLRERFDLILIDSSSGPKRQEAVDSFHNVDGIILVLEAGKTRRESAESVKKKIQAAGGVILGAVFNKRQYYIPDFIYKKL
ncbi:P-loop NTPase family protein [Citrifermentans bremense]|uniref:chromosome partitioning protein n=1 Tax=Citrifermentans bremense TaxID=60035 RepID=UPI0004060D4C|nr:chromosome partitioning protein [Citrifermentans bremense]